jgi:hypothetical protein
VAVRQGGGVFPREIGKRAHYHGAVLSEVRGRGGRALLLLSLAGAACSFRSGYDELGVCRADPVLCAPDAAVDPLAPDADPLAPDADPLTPDAAAAALGCGSLQLLRDRFDGSTIDATWVAQAGAGASVDQSGGVLVLGLTAGSGSPQARLSARNAYDLTSSELAATVLATGGQRTALEVRDSGGRGAALAVEGDVLFVMTLDGASEAIRVSMVYDPARHRHWRLREAGGALFWEVSADRTAWTTITSGSVGMDVSNAYAVLFARGQLAAASEARFDDVNVPVASVPGFCKVGTVHDGFDEPIFAADWSPWVGSGTCSARIVGGAAQIDFPGTGGSFCGVDTDRLLDLTGDAISFEMVAGPDDPTFVTFGELVTPDQVNRVDIRISDGTVRMRQVLAGSPVTSASIPYDATAHRFWRLREAGGRIFWDSSPDGATWRSRADATAQVEITAMYFTMAAGHDAPGPGGSPVVRFDRVNAP